MYAKIEKPKDDKSLGVTGSVAQKKSSGKQGFGFVDNRPESVVQMKIERLINNHSAFQSIQKKENNTGLPDNLKSGIGNLSRYSMNEVKVHYNSGKPAQLQTHAYAQGTGIYLASRQEKHLPHQVPRNLQNLSFEKTKSPLQLMVQGTVAQLEDYFVERFGADIMNVRIGDLRMVIDDTSAPNKERIRAEAILIEHEPLLAAYRQLQVHEVLQLIRGGRYNDALRFIVRMMGINLHGATISSVKEWTDVVDSSEVPRGGGLGLTMPGETDLDPPRIFIKQSVMIRWANTMEFGNLAATIAHEAIHAGQKARGEAEDDVNYREFEAHANEICDAHYRILNSDKEFYPSGSHMETAHTEALGHWGQINFGSLAAPLRLKAEALKKKMDADWNVVRSFTNKRDAESGLSDSKVKEFTILKNRLKSAYDEALPLENPSDNERLTELKAIAGEIGVASGRARGDMNENELKMIGTLDSEMQMYSDYFNRDWKFLVL